jgi:hypothetical protein
MVNCPRCRHLNPDHAERCGGCAGELFAVVASALTAPLPAPMVEPIDPPQKPPPDSKPLRARLAQNVSFNEDSDGIPSDSESECNGLDFSPPAFVDFPTMSSDESSGHALETINDHWQVAASALVQNHDRIAPGGTLSKHPGLSENQMNEVAIHPPEPATTPGIEARDQSSTPSPPTAPPRLLVLRGLKIGLEYPIYEGRNTIGRFADKPVDIDLLNQESIEQIWCSRQHAAITFSKGIIYIEDLNSLNKTWVNGSCVHAGQQRQLKPGDIIQVGTVQMKLVVG